MSSNHAISDLELRIKAVDFATRQHYTTEYPHMTPSNENKCELTAANDFYIFMKYGVIKELEERYGPSLLKEQSITI